MSAYQKRVAKSVDEFMGPERTVEVIENFRAEHKLRFSETAHAMLLKMFCSFFNCGYLQVGRVQNLLGHSELHTQLFAPRYQRNHIVG